MVIKEASLYGTYKLSNMFDLLLNNPQLTIFFRVLIEEAGVPVLISSATMLLYLGYKSTISLSDFVPLALLVSLATFIGSTFLFLISRHFGRYILNKYQNFFKRIHITPRTIRQMEMAMNNYGIWFLVLTRFTPGARVLGTIAAGMFSMSYKKFIAVAVPTSFVWALAYLSLGRILGQAYADILINLLNSRLAVLVAFALFIGVFVLLGKFLKPKIFPDLPEDDMSKPDSSV